MPENELLKIKTERLAKACNHEEADRIPIFAASGSATLDYAGVTYWDIENDQVAYDKMTDKFFGAVDFDAQWHYIGGNPRSHEYLFGHTEYFLADDGVTVQHLQDQNKLREDEYPAFTADPMGFLKSVLIPRKYPELFAAGKAEAVEILKKVIEEYTQIYVTGPNGQVAKYLTDKYGIASISAFATCAPAIDVIFDRFRGFKGTLTDIRRQPQAVLEACDALYDSPFCNKCIGLTHEFTFAAFLMAHIATYLNNKQFEKFYWPQLKNNILNLNKDGNKAYILTEGRWAHLLEYFLDVPKDSCFIHVDDDDLFEVNKKLGNHHTIGGGMKMETMKLHTKQECLDYARKAIDECAPGGGFIFCNDKTLSCNGDINENVIDTFNFAAEYGKYNK